MLSQPHRELFCRATTLTECLDARQWDAGRQLSEADLNGFEPEAVVQTHEGYADFVRAHGEPSESASLEGRELHVWRDVQMARGRARGALYLMEFDSGSNASWFTGEPA